MHHRMTLRGGVLGVLACGAAALSPSPAVASTVRAAAPVKAQLVTAGPVRPTRVHTPAFRPRNAAQFRQALDAANARYANWSAARTTAATVFGPLTAISNLSKPGMNASNGGGGTPPDTTGAIGPNGYVEFVNSQVAVYNRNTLASPPVATVSEDTFTGSSSTCDGQIKWDQAAQRWLYYSLDCAAATSSQGYSFGFSKTSSPTPLPSTTSAGNWCRYHVATASDLQDYGKLGNNNGYMIIGANEFNMTTGLYLDSPIWAWPKPANGTKVTTCPSESGSKFVPSSANEFTPEPANTFGSSANGFIVAINPDHAHLRQYTLSSASPPVLTDNGNITVPAFSQPAGIPQPGTTDRLDPSDTRLTQANAAVDSSLKTWAVWTQHTVAGSGGGPSVVRWYELKAGVAQSAPLQTGTISDGTLFAFNGGIAPDGRGNAAGINYDVGNASTDVQVRAQDHLPGAAAGTMANETTLATSTGINQDFSCPSQGSGSTSCRWGDYAGASTDPTCQGNVYGTNELNGPTSAGVTTWASQNFRLSLDECPTASFTDTISGLLVNFDGTASSDPDGSISTYTWKFGDGTTSTGTTATASHTYAAAGTYSVTLTVKDSSGLAGSVTHKVTVS